MAYKHSTNNLKDVNVEIVYANQYFSGDTNLEQIFALKGEGTTGVTGTTLTIIEGRNIDITGLTSTKTISVVDSPDFDGLSVNSNDVIVTNDIISGGTF